MLAALLEARGYKYSIYAISYMHQYEGRKQTLYLKQIAGQPSAQLPRHLTCNHKGHINCTYTLYHHTSPSDMASSTPKGIQRTILQAIPIPALPGWESRLVLLEYPPGVNAPLHDHPVASTGYIIEGACLSQWEGGEEEHYKAGESFVDHGERRHLRSENVSGEGKWLRFVASYVIKVGEPNVRPLKE
jgi:quercetin dioxygenase-like cupin family protein